MKKAGRIETWFTVLDELFRFVAMSSVDLLNPKPTSTHASSHFTSYFLRPKLLLCIWAIVYTGRAFHLISIIRGDI
ncbi:hypothetical protein BT96DRAFT_985364 [Gymnopus androsaceus JB14]|uniref:Uncharacterized protein n=1 Tax=Gymnopus androsaceus JB14 TaxID=1447944 RepID=A0A6A4IEK8_9AGAR|nr:hypothetical protein BT96DRAFT_985364 [Gymnopus androsaceus JB14]